MISSLNECQKIFAVVVTFNPSYDVIENIQALIKQVDLVIIVDNTSEEGDFHHLNMLGNSHKVVTIHNERNLGIGAALNIGIKHGLSLHYEWVLTFDQDSRISVGYVQEMMNSYKVISQNKDIAIVCPTYIQEKTGHIFAHRTDNLESFIGVDSKYSEVLTTITSGNLMRSNLFAKIGFLNEDFFIDLVDHEFCLRCRYAGLKIIEVHDVVLTHNLGDPIQKILLGFKINSSNHSHVRRYYKYRNSIIICHTWFPRYPLFFLRQARGFLLEPLKILIMEKKKNLKILYILKGIQHGLKNIQGEIPKC